MKKIKRIKTLTSKNIPCQETKNNRINAKENNFLNTEIKLDLSKKIKTQPDIFQDRSPTSGMQIYFMKTKRLKLFPKSKSTLRQKNFNEETNRFDFGSNFQILKKQIQNLQDQSFHKIAPQSQNQNFSHQFEFDNIAASNNYIVNSQFISTKKTALFEKKRKNIKICHKNRRIDLMLGKDNHNQVGQKKIQSLALKNSFLSLHITTNSEIFINKNLKKKQTPQIIKKYYRFSNSRSKKINSKVNFNSTTSQLKGQGLSIQTLQKEHRNCKNTKRRSLSVINKRQQTQNQQNKDEETFVIYL